MANFFCSSGFQGRPDCEPFVERCVCLSAMTLDAPCCHAPQAPAPQASNGGVSDLIKLHKTEPVHIPGDLTGGKSSSHGCIGVRFEECHAKMVKASKWVRVHCKASGGKSHGKCLKFTCCTGHEVQQLLFGKVPDFKEAG